MNAGPRKNTSLQAKSSARLVAVQLLYQSAVRGGKADAEKLSAAYKQFVEDSMDPKEAHLPAVPPDMSYMRKLLRGVIEHADALEPIVEKILDPSWKKTRINPLLLAILRVAAFEAAHTKLAPAILVDEYASLTQRFLDEADTAFIHAALHELIKHLR